MTASPPPGQPSGLLSDGIRVLLAPNPGPMTLTGTNTYVLGDPAGEVLVVDPGPLDERHLTAIVAACPAGASAILLTHWHHDHSDAAAELADRLDAPVRSVATEFRIGERGLDDGEELSADGVALEVIGTPGHTADSVCFLVRTPDGARLLTGDTVLGTGTSVIMHPDGHLGSYLASLDRLSDAVEAEGVRQLLPGHGPVVDDPGGWLDFYRTHREQRLDQVRAALAAGDRTAAEVVARVYAEVDRSVWPAAERSVEAQLEYLRRS